MKEDEQISPPKLFRTLLKWFCHPDLLEDLEGDLSELFYERAIEYPSKAKRLFMWDVINLMRLGIFKELKIINSLKNNGMLKNYIKIAFRNAMRYKSYTVINVLGLMVGISSAILILLWVNDEANMNKFHEGGDNKFQVFRNMHQSNGEVITANYIPQPVSGVLKAEYPEINEITMVGWEMESLIRNGEDFYREDGFYASTEFFRTFNFPLIKGDANSVLNDLNAIVISEKLAKSFFGENWRGNQSIIGKTLKLDEEDEYMISGVFEDVKSNSSLQFDYVLSIDKAIKEARWMNSWGTGSTRIYIDLNQPSDLDAVAQRIEQEINDHIEDPVDERLILQKFEDTYLYSEYENGVLKGGRILYVKILSVVAIFMLLIASINFMNLVTARSGRRSKEVGLRKVMGAGKESISLQFFVESYLFTLFSVLLSVLMVIIILPFFNLLVEKSISVDFGSSFTWLFLSGLVVVIGFMSGIYPAILLPTFKIINALKGTTRHSSGSANFRKGLVVFQFAISMLLIIGTFVIYQQMSFVLNKDLGLNKENVLIVEMEGSRNRAATFQTYKNELLNIPEVTAVTAATGSPISYGRSTGSAVWDAKDPNENAEVGIILVNDEFFETMGMEIVAGRSFSKEFGSDSLNYVINETAAKLMGFNNPVDQNLSIWGRKGKVVGVVKDFHTKDLYEAIAPMVIAYEPEDSRVALIRVSNVKKETIEAIEELTVSLNPLYQFRFELMSDTYTKSYRSDMIVSKLANIFAGISIFISCLGLFALSAFSAEQRSKEIGVRKVHGAAVTHIMLMLSKEYAVLMIISIILAIPMAYYYAGEWLNNFEYRSELNPLLFLLAGVVAFVIGILAVSFKSFQAASVNPVKSLKAE